MALTEPPYLAGASSVGAMAHPASDSGAETGPAARIDIRPLETIAQIHEAAEVLREVWVGDRDAMPPNLVRALAHSGNYVVGMYDGDRMVGASIAFFAPARGSAVRAALR